MKAIVALLAGIVIGWTGAVFVGAYRFSRRHWPERVVSAAYPVEISQVYQYPADWSLGFIAEVDE